MSAPQTVALDRTLKIPPGALVRTAWVPHHQVRFACRERMAVGDVEAAYRRLLAAGECGTWPPPTGWWDGDTFVVQDGRHSYIASLMLGHRALLVAWVDGTPVKETR